MSFCSKSVLTTEKLANQHEGILLSDPDFQMAVFKSMAEVPSDWETAQPAGNCFLHRNYLKVVENTPSTKITFRYLIFYKKNF